MKKYYIAINLVLLIVVVVGCFLMLQQYSVAKESCEKGIFEGSVQYIGFGMFMYEFRCSLSYNLFGESNSFFISSEPVQTWELTHKAMLLFVFTNSLIASFAVARNKLIKSLKKAEIYQMVMLWCIFILTYILGNIIITYIKL